MQSIYFVHFKYYIFHQYVPTSLSSFQTKQSESFQPQLRWKHLFLQPPLLPRRQLLLHTSFWDKRSRTLTKILDDVIFYGLRLHNMSDRTVACLVFRPILCTANLSILSPIAAYWSSTSTELLGYPSYFPNYAVQKPLEVIHCQLL